jgi:hypothetical protein
MLVSRGCYFWPEIIFAFFAYFDNTGSPGAALPNLRMSVNQANSGGFDNLTARYAGCCFLA